MKKQLLQFGRVPWFSHFVLESKSFVNSLYLWIVFIHKKKSTEEKGMGIYWKETSFFSRKNGNRLPINLLVLLLEKRKQKHKL